MEAYLACYPGDCCTDTTVSALKTITDANKDLYGECKALKCGGSSPASSGAVMASMSTLALVLFMVYH